jgi:membrane protease YdiL (CAAX protease family)
VLCRCFQKAHQGFICNLLSAICYLSFASTSRPMSPSNIFRRTFLCFVMAALIAVLSLGAPQVLHLPGSPSLPRSFFTHSLMLLLSLAAMMWLSKGKLSQYGLTVGTFRFSAKYLLWLLPTAVISILEMISSHGNPTPTSSLSFSPLTVVLFIWIYASISEEIFVRGLVQSYLAPFSQYRIKISNTRSISFPIFFGAVFFGLMHVVLWPRLGLAALVPIAFATLLGFIAGYYREATGSVLPAIVVHALFNIGGTVPGWIVNLLTLLKS